MPMPDIVDFQHLSIAAAIGFLVGFQREWRHAEQAKSRSFAGARTFALIGFFGGLAGLIGGDGVVAVAVGLAAVAGLTIAAYWAEAREAPGTGGTTEIALLATYLLGALATRGAAGVAAAGGVLVAIILALKPLVQRWASHMGASEINASLRFLAISVVVLPLLPNEGFGPYEALNPREMWWMVVLISGLSFAGYWLTKFYGARGVLITGIVGGLASSTATTVSLSRFEREGSASARSAAAGIVAANVVMLGRISVLLAVIAPKVLLVVWPALAAGAGAGVIMAALMWRARGEQPSELKLGNPMELRPALLFAAMLAVVAVASRLASDRFGDSGLYAVALVTGLADVDALTLTAGGQAHAGDIGTSVAALAVLLAAASNTIVKGAMTFAIAGRRLGIMVAGSFTLLLASAAAGWVIAALA